MTVFFHGEDLEFICIELNTGTGDLADFLCISQLNIFTHILVLVFNKSMNNAMDNHYMELLSEKTTLGHAHKAYIG